MSNKLNKDIINLYQKNLIENQKALDEKQTEEALIEILIEEGQIPKEMIFRLVDQAKKKRYQRDAIIRWSFVCLAITLILVSLYYIFTKIDNSKSRQSSYSSIATNEKNNLKELSKQMGFEIYNVNEDSEVPLNVLTPVIKKISISITKDGVIKRERIGPYPENASWVIKINGETVLQRNADNELSYKYFRYFEDGIFTVYVTQVILGKYHIVSNILSFETR